MESNHRPPPYQGGALPTELRERGTGFVSRVVLRRASPMERETGIEPAPSAWKAEVLPLNYSRAGRKTCCNEACCKILVEGGGFEPPKA